MSIRILLADDHNLVREALATLIQKQDGMEVVGQAEDGREVSQLAMDLHPDVIVMDVTMPGMSGAEATRRIKARLPSAKVLALSIHKEGPFVMEMLRAGAAGYLLKTCAVDELVRAIKSVVANQTYLSPQVGSSVADALFPQKGDGDGIPLTQREREVLQLTAEGLTTKQIASRLTRSVKTIEMHRRNIMKKLGLHNIAAITKYAIRIGLASLDD